jgi:stage V sporulation protein K
MSKSIHIFSKNTCQNCGVSRAAVDHFKWECEPRGREIIVKCAFCDSKNRIALKSDKKAIPLCGKCRLPLFISPNEKEMLIEDMVGLDSVKIELNRIIASVKINKARTAKGLPKVPQALNFVFYGGPGTGKTQVARLLAKGLREAGLLKKDHLIEVDRSSLVGQYQGHTAKKVSDVFSKALEGVLFIDEAYSLSSGKDDDFGNEAIDTLVKLIEDNRDRVVVIVAGYKNEIEEFLNINPGLKSRFTRFIDFPNYSIQELCDIFRSILNKNGQFLSKEANIRLSEILLILNQHDKDFGNARGARNVAEKIYAIQSVRLELIENPTKEQYAKIELEDFYSLLVDFNIPEDVIKKFKKL